MLSWKVVVSYPILALLIGVGSAEDATYWVSPSCIRREGFEDALKEVLWGSGKLADAINQRDPRLDQPVQWFFGFSITQTPQIDYVENTYRRVSKMKRQDDQASANIRFMCDSGASFWPKNKKGEKIAEPAPDKKLKSGYHDEENDMWEVGRLLPIRFKHERALAHTSPHILQKNKALMKTRYENTQQENRAVISMCDMLFDPTDDDGSQEEKNPLWMVPTFRELALMPLDAIPDLRFISTHLALTIMHELVHVPILSRQEDINWELENPSQFVKSVGELGQDNHGKNKINGYYRNEFPAKVLGDWRFTVMNPDSYAYLFAIFRLQNKQWEPKIKTQDEVEVIGLEKNEGWEVVGDWDNAGDPPAPGSRVRPVYS